ncbi:MAG: ATP-binding protein [Bacteroidales bacterium]|nr:ATP-binding protein [Bacteroidales bacterium]MBN2819353.1 ATP-binding protein [Bacteroidales bacterium]
MKNALEASLEGDVVNIQTNIKDENLIIEVNNKQEMSVEAKHKIFHRSFSSKGLNRRMGTYSIKLLGEKFLKGKVAFISNAINGTTFYLSIPLELKQSIN